MSPNSDKPNSQPGDNDDQQEDVPIAGLVDLEQDISPAFLTAVRKKINRRSTASLFAAFSWQLPKMVLGEFWNALVQLLQPRHPQKGGRP